MRAKRSAQPGHARPRAGYSIGNDIVLTYCFNKSCENRSIHSKLHSSPKHASQRQPRDVASISSGHETHLGPTICESTWSCMNFASTARRTIASMNITVRATTLPRYKYSRFMIRATLRSTRGPDFSGATPGFEGFKQPSGGARRL